MPGFARTALAIGLLVASLSLSGCVLSQIEDGSRLIDEAVAQIAPGSSTRADVTRLLGPPDEIVHSNKEHDPLFEKVYIYKRPRTRQTGLVLVIFSTYRSDTRYDKVAIFFDERGVVEHVGARLDATEASYGMPW